MKPNDELLKKKKKRPSRFVRFIFILIFIIAVVSLIFYNVDNPGFIPSIKDKIVAFYSSNESTATDSSTTSTSVESSSESVSSTTGSDTVIENPTNNKFLLLWQKIISFFIKRANHDVN